jgi:hypothetical protein
METFFYSAWAATLSLMIVLGVQEDSQKERAKYWLPLDALSGGIALFGLLAFRIEILAVVSGKLLVPISILAAIEVSISAYLELSQIEPEEDLSDAENKFAIAGGAIIICVVYGGGLSLGIIRGLEAFVT